MPHFRLRLAALGAMAGLALGGCSAPEPPASDTLTVVTTFTVMADMVQQVAGDRATVASLTRPGVEVHGYEPTVADVIRTSEADLVLHHGWNLEGWFANFITRVDATHVTVTDTMEPVMVAGTDVINPHAWISPQRGTEYIDAIEQALIAVDPDGAATYRANADTYRAELEQVAAMYDDAVQALPDSARVLVTCEGAFSYLAQDYGLTEVYLWPINAEYEPTSQSLARAIDHVRDHQVPAVFCESTVSADTMMQVVSATDATFGGTFYVDSLTQPDGPAPTYLDLLRHNAQVLTQAWAGAP